MGNCYMNRGIKLFKQLPYNIKLMGHKIKFKSIVKRWIGIRLFP